METFDSDNFQGTYLSLTFHPNPELSRIQLGITGLNKMWPSPRRPLSLAPSPFAVMLFRHHLCSSLAFTFLLAPCPFLTAVSFSFIFPTSIF